MKCTNCGRKLTGKENFCRICGTPVKKENDNVVVEEIKDNSKPLELTDNIDISKIEIQNESTSLDDTVDVENKDIQESKELTAMIELSTSDDDNNELDNNIDVAVNKNLGESEKDSSEKIREILEEIKPKMADSEIEVDEMKEPTSIIPENLIDEYKKNVDDSFNEIENNPAGSLENIDKKDNENIGQEEKETEEKNEIDSSNIETDDIKENDSNIEEENEKIEKNDVNNIKEEIKVEDNEKDTFLDKESDEKKDEIKEEKVISIVDEKTLPIEISKDKTQVYDEPLLSSDEQDDDFNIKRSGDAKGIIFFILFIVTLLSLIVLGFLFYNTNNKLNKVNKEYESIKADLNSSNNIVENKTNDNDIKSNEFINYNGYSINLTDKYNFSNNKLIINKDEKTISVTIKKDLKYSTIKYSKDEYRDNLESESVKVKSYGTKVINDREYVVYELSESDKNNYLVAYTTLSDDDTIGFIINTTNNSYDYDELENLNKFIDNIKSYSLNNDSDINLFIK